MEERNVSSLISEYDKNEEEIVFEGNRKKMRIERIKEEMEEMGYVPGHSKADMDSLGNRSPEVILAEAEKELEEYEAQKEKRREENLNGLIESLQELHTELKKEIMELKKSILQNEIDLEESKTSRDSSPEKVSELMNKSEELEKLLEDKTGELERCKLEIEKRFKERMESKRVHSIVEEFHEFSEESIATEPKVEPEAKPRVEPEVKPRVEPEAKPRVEPEAKPRVEPEVKPRVVIKNPEITIIFDAKEKAYIFKDITNNYESKISLENIEESKSYQEYMNLNEDKYPDSDLKIAKILSLYDKICKNNGISTNLEEVYLKAVDEDKTPKEIAEYMKKNKMNIQYNLYNVRDKGLYTRNERRSLIKNARNQSRIGVASYDKPKSILKVIQERINAMFNNYKLLGDGTEPKTDKKFKKESKYTEEDRELLEAMEKRREYIKHKESKVDERTVSTGYRDFVNWQESFVPKGAQPIVPTYSQGCMDILGSGSYEELRERLGAADVSGFTQEEKDAIENKMKELNGKKDPQKKGEPIVKESKPKRFINKGVNKVRNLAQRAGQELRVAGIKIAGYVRGDSQYKINTAIRNVRSSGDEGR